MKDGEVPFEWFERADYPNVRDLMEDKHRLPASFEVWEKSAEAGEQALSNSRHIVVRTIVESHKFAAWCRERKLKANAQSRLRYCKEQHASAAAEPEGSGNSSDRISAQADMVREGATTATPGLVDSAQPGSTLLERSRDFIEKIKRLFRSL